MSHPMNPFTKARRRATLRSTNLEMQVVAALLRLLAFTEAVLRIVGYTSHNVNARRHSSQVDFAPHYSADGTPVLRVERGLIANSCHITNSVQCRRKLNVMRNALGGSVDLDRLTSLAEARDPVHVVVSISLDKLIGLRGLVWSIEKSATMVVTLFHIIVLRSECHLLRQKILSLFHSKHRVSLFDWYCIRLTDINIVVRRRYRQDLRQPIVYTRYFLHRVLPQSLEKVIYLDVDIVVQGNLEKLYRFPLNQYPIGAAVLSRSNFQANFNFMEVCTKDILAGINPKENIFNTGVLLYNLTMWREQDYEGLLWKLVHLNSQCPLYGLGSQPPMNILFRRNFAALPATWNVMDAGDPKLSPGPLLLQLASIVHYNGVNKPWLLPRRLDSEFWTRHYPSWEEDLLEQQYTVVIPVGSTKRLQSLCAVLQHLSGVKRIYEVLLIWNVLDSPCSIDALNSCYVLKKWVRCLAMRENFVHNRLRIADEIHTECVLHHDDDALLHHDGMELGFKVWSRFINQVVGFQPRWAGWDPILSQWSYTFDLPSGHYNVIIGKFFFLSRNLMRLYVSKEGNIGLPKGHFCEDLVLNALVSNYTSKPPILVHSYHEEIATGIGASTSIAKSEWMKVRRNCLQQISTASLNWPISTNKVVVGYDCFQNELRWSELLGGSICSDLYGTRPCKLLSKGEATSKQ